MTIIEQGRSEKGIEVILQRELQDCSPFLTVLYGAGKSPGQRAYFPDNLLGRGLAEEVKDRFLEDRNTLGEPFYGEPPGEFLLSEKGLYPLRAIRTFCLGCVENYVEVENCTADGRGGYEVCPFHPYRFGKKPSQGAESRLKVIRRFCLWCMGGNVKVVEGCRSECVLHPYRRGKNPARKGLGRRGGTPENFAQNRP